MEDTNLGPRGRATRDELLDRAIERFGEAGFRDTSVSQIARDTGLKQAAVYRYFGSKQELFDAAVEQAMTQMLDDAFALPNPLTVSEAVPSVMLRIQEAVEDHPLMRRVLANQESGVLARLVDAPFAVRVESELLEMMVDAQANGEMRDDVDPVAMARGYFTIMYALLIARTSVGPDPRAGGVEGVLAVTDAALQPLSTTRTPSATDRGSERPTRR